MEFATMQSRGEVSREPSAYTPTTNTLPLATQQLIWTRQMTPYFEHEVATARALFSGRHEFFDDSISATSLQLVPAALRLSTVIIALPTVTRQAAAMALQIELTCRKEPSTRTSFENEMLRSLGHRAPGEISQSTRP